MKLRVEVHKQLIKLWKECIEEFVREASKHIAIDTGMSMASMMPLAAKVRMASFLRSKIQGKSSGPKRGYTDMNFQYHKSQFKSVAHGQRLGKRAYILRFGTPTLPNLSFEFDITVLQHWLHEDAANYQRSHNWQSLVKAKKAFLEAWDAFLPYFVDAYAINNWLLTGQYHAGR